mgnify:CR=1 FL=1
MFEFTMTKEDVENKLSNDQAKIAKLRAEWKSLLDINRGGVKLTDKQQIRLTKIKKDSSILHLAVSIAKEILEEESYKK